MHDHPRERGSRRPPDQVGWKLVSLSPWQGGAAILVPSHFTAEQTAEAVERHERRADR